MGHNLYRCAHSILFKVHAPPENRKGQTKTFLQHPRLICWRAAGELLSSSALTNATAAIGGARLIGALRWQLKTAGARIGVAGAGAAAGKPGRAGVLAGFPPGHAQPVAVTAVVAMAVALSFAQRLGLEREMLYAIARAFLQLSVVGSLTYKELLFLIWPAVEQVTVAGYTAGQRAKHVPRGRFIAFVSILQVGTAVTMLVLVLLKVFPFTPRYIIPVAGMLVGCAMTVTGVTMKKLREDVKIQRNMVETALVLGATPGEATLQQVRRSLGIALAPVIDNAKTVGLTALPGAMTGLIMGGASPLEAIQMLIVVKNMVMAANTVSSIVSYLCWTSFFTKAFQLKDEVFADE